MAAIFWTTIGAFALECWFLANRGTPFYTADGRGFNQPALFALMFLLTGMLIAFLHKELWPAFYRSYWIRREAGRLADAQMRKSAQLFEKRSETKPEKKVDKHVAPKVDALDDLVHPISFKAKPPAPHH